MYKGTILIALISTIFYFIPIINNKYWYLTLIYFFIITLFLTVSLHFNAGERRLALAYHVIYTMNINYKIENNYHISDIWFSWLLVPMAIILSSIAVLIPFPIFSYQQLLFIEEKSINTIQAWLQEMIKFLQCKDKIHSKIQLTKLSKYPNQSYNHKNHLYLIYPDAKNFELLNEKNEIINKQRMIILYTMHYVLLAMFDTLQSIQTTKNYQFYQCLIEEIKDSFQIFCQFLLKECLEKKSMDNERKTQLIRYNDQLLNSYQIARHKLIYNNNNNNNIDIDDNLIKSTNVLHSFIYFLNLLTEKIICYLQLYSNLSQQKKLKRHQKCNLFCSLSLYQIFYPFPFKSFNDLKDKLSPLIHWKCDIFLQSLSITIALTLCSILFIIPDIHNRMELGYWAALTVAFVSDTHIGGTFYTSQLRLEGTFLGVVCGFIILQLHSGGMPEIYGIFILTIWVIFTGYYRSNPSRGYSGLVAAFTAALIVIGYDEDKGYKIEYYAIRRIEMTFVGIATILIILQCFSPNNARKLLHKEMYQSLNLLREIFDENFKRYKEMINGSKIYDNDNNNDNDNDDIKENDKEESKNDVELDLIANKSYLNGEIVEEHSNEMKIFKMRDSPNKLYEKFREKKLKITKLLDSEKMLINAAVFEPMLYKNEFDDESHLRLHHIQFWILRRVSQIDSCLRSCLLYVEKQNESQWLLNKELLHDTEPFKNYLKIYTKCHKVIIEAMDYFIKELISENNKNNKNNNKSYSDIMFEIESTMDHQWLEFENMMNEYRTTRSLSDIDIDKNNKFQIVSTKGALLINALGFALFNLMKSLSEFAQCKISH